MYGLTILEPPTQDPIMLETFKSHLRLNGLDDEDDMLEIYLNAAVEHAEESLGRQLATATWTLTLDGFPQMIRLPKAPVITVDEIRYFTDDWIVLDETTYNVDTSRNPARIVPKRYFPPLAFSGQTISPRVEVDFTCGYGDPAGSGTNVEIPWRLLNGILGLAAYYYDNRECQGFPEGWERVAAQFDIGYYHDMNRLDSKYCGRCW